jgi:hypothetical protein
VAGLMPGEWMGWLHGCFLVPHFVLFRWCWLFRLCLICLPFCACSQVMVTQTVTLKVTIYEISRCGLGAGGYGGLVMPTVLMTLYILSCSTHTESQAGTQILLALPLRLWMG